MKGSALDSYLDFYLSNEDVKNPKPHPDIYNAAIERLGLMPNEVIIVEDNPHGIQAATASGGYVLEVQTIYDVTYESIISRIEQVENKSCAI